MKKIFRLILSFLFFINQYTFMLGDQIVVGKISPSRISATNSPSDGDVATYDSASGAFTWEASGAGVEITDIQTTTTTKYLPTILDTQTLSATTTTVSFSSISQSYTDLEIKILARSTRSASDNDTIKMSFNSDTTDANYLFGEFLGDGSNPSGFSQDADGRELSDTPATSSPANDYGYIIIEIPEYTNTSINKMAIARAGVRFSATQQREAVQTLTWENTNAITDIDFNLANANYASGSIFILVGYKNETIVTDVTGSGFVKASDFIDGGNTATANLILGTNTTYDLNIETDNTTRMTFDSAGDIIVFDDVTMTNQFGFLMGTGTQVKVAMSYGGGSSNLEIKEFDSSKPAGLNVVFNDSIYFSTNQWNVETTHTAQTNDSTNSFIRQDAVLYLDGTTTGTDYILNKSWLNIDGTGTLETGSLVNSHLMFVPGAKAMFDGNVEDLIIVAPVILDDSDTGTFTNVVAYSSRWLPLGGSHTISGDWTYYHADGDQILTTVSGSKIGLNIQNVDSNLIDGTTTMTGQLNLTNSVYITGGLATGGDTTLIKTKTVSIGDWNMDADATATIAHGLSNFFPIDVGGMIVNDSGGTFRPIGNYTTANAGTSVDLGVDKVDATNVILKRGSALDNTSYDQTSYNRGYVVVRYIDV